MRVFVPVTDQMFVKRAGIIKAKMVPFNPEFLEAQSSHQEQSGKPENWVSKSDYESARKRLSARSTVGSPS
jgi:hypothetical protein